MHQCKMYLLTTIVEVSYKKYVAFYIAFLLCFFMKYKQTSVFQQIVHKLT